MGIEIAAPQATGIEMKEPRIGTSLLNPNLKLREKIVTQLV